MEKIEKKLDRIETLWSAGIAFLCILIAFMLNFTFKFPIAWDNIWIYGMIALAGGFLAYFIALFFLESYHFFLEIFSIGIIAVGEFLILAYFLAIETLWISVYFLIPSVTFLGLAILTYDLHPPEIKNRRDISGGVIVVSGALILLMIEAIFRGFVLFQIMIMPNLGIILIAGGLLAYIFLTWEILKKPNYIVTLITAAIISTGILLIEIYNQVYEPLFMTIFLAPGAVFFLLLLINYRLLRTKAISKSEFSHQSGLTLKHKEKAEPEP
jgi:hypothetical protein